MEIRQFTEKDLTKLALLEKGCFSDPWTLEMLKSEIDRDGFCGLLCEEAGESVGFVYGNVLFDDAELYKIAVLPLCRGKGVGKKLAAAFLDLVKAKGARQVFWKYAYPTKRLCRCTWVKALKKRGSENAITRMEKTAWS